MDHSIPSAISIQGTLFMVRGTDKGPSTLPVVRSMKGSGATIKAMQRLTCNTVLPHTVYTHTPINSVKIQSESYANFLAWKWQITLRNALEVHYKWQKTDYRSALIWHPDMKPILNSMFRCTAAVKEFATLACRSTLALYVHLTSRGNLHFALCYLFDVCIL